MSQKSILITGATGNIGRPLVRLLQAAGAAVIAGSPSGESVEGAPGRVVDFNDPSAMKTAFADVATLFLLFPLVPQKVALARNAVAAAKAAGVGHILRSSAAGADQNSPLAVGKLQGEIDQIVIDSGIPFTLVRPNGFMQNYVNYYAGMLKAGTLYASHGEARVSFIDVRDIADVDAAILLNPAAHVGKIYTVTGPEALGHHDAVHLVAAAIGRPVIYVPVPEEVAVKSMTDMGMDPWTINIMSSLNQGIAAGNSAAVSRDVQTITGHPSRTFATFVRDNVAAWQ
jgi:uncharacterized protein YbjT (DUF2867 family)